MDFLVLLTFVYVGNILAFKMSEINNMTIEKAVSFQWDEGNSDKNWSKHSITQAECEQVFF